jgi:L-rhamnose isomerase/sugar isomerase
VKISTDEILDQFRIELPSWGFNNVGTRFGVFPQQGAPRSALERIEDAGHVHRFTGGAPTVSLHIPWDRTESAADLAKHARDQGVAIGAINSNTFQDGSYRLGSLAHHDPSVRRRATAHIAECCDVARATQADALKVWLGDGTNYPGQDSFRLRKSRLADALREVHSMLPETARLLIEYKPYEPAFYHTDIQDWGMALLLARHAGERAQVVVDVGHHFHGVNIEQIVAILLDEGRLGSFDLNDRKYGDDDLIAGAINPYQLFLIFNELVDGSSSNAPAHVKACASQVLYMVDQAHNVEPRIPAMILTVMTLQENWMKANLVDREALQEAQAAGDILEANRCLKAAFDTDVRPMIVAWRESRGLPADPFAAYIASGIEAKRAATRQDGVPVAWH